MIIGNPYFKKAFEKLGHTVTAVSDYTGEGRDVSRADADIILVHENLGMRLIPEGIERANALTIFYSVDVHLNLYWHREYAKLFDYVFVSQKDYIEKIKHGHIAWLPWSIYPEIFFDHRLDRVHDIVFCGTLNEHRKKRTNIIEGLKKRFDVKLYGTDPKKRVIHKELAKIYSQSKLILNESIFGEMTFRTFEAAACGGMLFTEKVENGLLDLFTDGQDIVTYSPNDLIDRAEYCLSHDIERKEIAENGKQKVLKNHTAYIRAQTILDTLEKNGFRQTRQEKSDTDIYLSITLYFTGMRFQKFKKQRLYRAKALLNNLCFDYQNQYKPFYWLANVYEALGRIEEAKTTLQKYLSNGDDNNFFILSALGFIELNKGSTDNAIKIFKKISPQLNPKSHDFYQLLGNEFEKRGHSAHIGFIGRESIIPLDAIDCYLQGKTAYSLLHAIMLNCELGLYESSIKLFKILEKNGYKLNSEEKFLLGLSHIRCYDFE